MTWHGRRGSVLLGPTENRVARWLLDLTRTGRVTIRTVDLAAATNVERSEAYRITARLRTLGLFGIENDRGGTLGGRRYWRTAVEHDGSTLDPARHREAWARILAWARTQRARVRARLAAIRGNHMSVPGALHGTRARFDEPAGEPPLPAGSQTFADRMRRAGLGRLMNDWGI